jgi:predicted nucleic acid-binding protein
VRIAGLDSVTLIYAFKEFLPGVSYPEYDRVMASRAKILMQNLEIESATIVVPAIVVTEYLVGIEPEHHEATMSVFREAFEIPPFDLKAVSIAAKLWRAHRTLPVEEQLGRIVLKADVLIVATAKAFGVTHYYSNDKGSRRLAEQAGLIAQDLPERSPYLIPDAIEPKRSKKSKKPPPQP